MLSWTALTEGSRGLDPKEFHMSLPRTVLSLLLFSSLFFMIPGCTIDDPVASAPRVGLDTRLVGSWSSEASEVYTISETHLYYEAWDEWGGEIVYAAQFNDETGIIIIRYDDDAKQVWSIYDQAWNVVGQHDMTGLDYYGIYYRDLSSDKVVFSNTNDQQNYGPTETSTLRGAINRFGFHNMSDWIDESFKPIYTRN